jgi:hypothetical protein
MISHRGKYYSLFLTIVEAGVETNVFGSGAQIGGSFGKISLKGLSSEI